jgi:hypothetical protein
MPYISSGSHPVINALIHESTPNLITLVLSSRSELNLSIAQTNVLNFYETRKEIYVPLRYPKDGKPFIEDMYELILTDKEYDIVQQAIDDYATSHMSLPEPAFKSQIERAVVSFGSLKSLRDIQSRYLSKCKRSSNLAEIKNQFFHTDENGRWCEVSPKECEPSANNNYKNLISIVDGEAHSVSSKLVKTTIDSENDVARHDFIWFANNTCVGNYSTYELLSECEFELVSLDVFHIVVSSISGFEYSSKQSLKHRLDYFNKHGVCFARSETHSDTGQQFYLTPQIMKTLRIKE